MDPLRSIIDADFDESILAVNLLEHEYRLTARDREIVSVFDRFRPGKALLHRPIKDRAECFDERGLIKLFAFI